MLKLICFCSFFVLCFGSIQKDTFTDEFLISNENMKDNTDQINVKYQTNPNNSEIDKTILTIQETEALENKMNKDNSHLIKIKQKDNVENFETSIEYVIENKDQNCLQTLKKNEINDIERKNESDNLIEENAYPCMDILSEQNKNKSASVLYYDNINVSGDLDINHDQNNHQLTPEINDDLANKQTPVILCNESSFHNICEESDIDYKSTLQSNNIKEKTLSQLFLEKQSNLDSEEVKDDDISEFEKIINNAIKINSVTHEKEKIENDINFQIENNIICQEKIKHNKILKTAEELKLEAEKDLLNYPFTINIISEKGKKIQIDYLNLDENLYIGKHVIDSYFVLKIFIKTQARKNLFSCNVLVNRIDKILHKKIVILDDPVCEENEYYKIIYYSTASKISKIIKREYNSSNIAKEQNIIIHSFDLITIIPNPIFQLGIEKIITWIKRNYYKKAPIFYNLSCFIVALKINLNFEVLNTLNFQKYVDETNLGLEIDFTNNFGDIHNYIFKPNLYEIVICDESRRNEVKITNVDLSTNTVDDEKLNIKKHYILDNKCVDFKFNYNPKYSESPNSTYSLFLSKENRSLDYCYNLSLSAKIIHTDDDFDNRKVTIEFKISENQQNKSTKNIENYKNLKITQNSRCKDIQDIEFQLEWFLDKSTNTLSKKNTKNNFDDHKKYMNFLENMNALCTYYTKLITSEDFISFEVFFNDKIHFITQELSYFHSNINFQKFTYSKAISYILKFLNFTDINSSFEVYSYDVNEIIQIADIKKGCNFLNKFIPGIKDHDFYKNELIKYTNFKKVSINNMKETLEKEKGLFIVLKLASDKTLYVTLRYIQGELLELDNNEKLLIEPIFYQLSECMSKHLVYEYCHYDMKMIKPFFDLKYKIWKIILKTRNFLCNIRELPTPDSINKVISNRINNIEYPKVLKDDFPIDKKKVKSLGEICTRSFFNYDELNSEFEKFKIEILKIFKNHYAKIYSQRKEYGGLFFGYFYRSSDIDGEDNYFNQRISFWI